MSLLNKCEIIISKIASLEHIEISSNGTSGIGPKA